MLCTMMFTGLGKYEREFPIDVDSNVTPVIQLCWNVPYAWYDKLKHTLVDLEKRGVIASVDRPTVGTQPGHNRKT